MSVAGVPFSRRGVLAGGAAVAAATLAGCGGKAGGAGGGSAEEGDLQVWGGVAEDRGPGALVEAFNKLHPKINVTYTPFVNNQEGILKLDTALQGGVPIDVFFSYGTSELARRSKAGLAMDLTDRAAADDTAKIFTEGDPISTTFDGKLYSIPTTHYPEFVLINEALIKKAGIDIPFDWDVDQYHQIAAELHSKTGIDAGAFNAPRLASSTLGGDYIYDDDGKKSAFDNPLFADELRNFLDMQKDGSIFTQKKITAEKIDTYPQNYFLNSSFAMFLNGTSSLRFIRDTENYPHDFRTTFRPYPAPSKKTAKSQKYWNPGVRGDDVQIAEKSKFKDAAWTFVKFWLSEGQKYIAQAGKISPFDVEDPPKDLLANVFGPDREKLFDLEAFQKVFFADKPELSVRIMTAGYSEIATLKGKIEEEVRLGTKSVDQAVSEMKKRADAAITKAS